MEAHRGHPRREEHGMLLRNAHVVIAFWHRLFENLETGAAGHGRGNADDGIVLLTKLHHGLTEHILPVRRRARLGRRTGPRLDVIRTGAMKLFRLLDRHTVASALPGRD